MRKVYTTNHQNQHWVRSVRIRSFSGPHFPTFGLNTERYALTMRENTNQKNSEYGHFSRSANIGNCFELKAGNLSQKGLI